MLKITMIHELNKKYVFIKILGKILKLLLSQQHNQKLSHIGQNNSANSIKVAKQEKSWLVSDKIRDELIKN